MRSRWVLYSLAGALVFAGCLDRKKIVGTDAAEPGGDAALSGAEVPAAVPTLDGATLDTNFASDLSSRDTTDVPLPGTGGAGGAGVDGATEGGGVPGVGGSSGTTGGAPGSGGAVGAGGTVATGGLVGTGGRTGTGGIVGTGGMVGTGGAVGTGGTTTCQPKARDCTSSLDNNCNGTPDNQETSYCACPVGNSRRCQEHAGYDGVGICKYGDQTCAASSDKTTSSWSDCIGAVAPNPSEVCDAAGLDENCNGQSNEGCECVNGASVPCECGPATTCTNGKKGTCSVTKEMWYRDSDGDGHGNPAQPAQVCPNASGYAKVGDDCDDSTSGFKPGVSLCTTLTERRWCEVGGGGVTKTQTCDQGCITGECRTDGTIGLPAYVSCAFAKRCLAYPGCNLSDSACAPDGVPGTVHCDGPNDCDAASVCCSQAGRGIVYAECYPGACPSNYRQVCDPRDPVCNCLADQGDWLYTCQ